MKKIPYGVANFKEIINSNMYYIDKTMYLKTIEDKDRNLFFIRPKRFGKSLFLSMMGTYYDVNEKDKFEHYFGNLHVGQEGNKTDKANKYLILSLNFSSVSTIGGKEGLLKSFDDEVVISINRFLRRYKDIVRVEKLPDEYKNAISGLKFLYNEINEDMEVMLLIDEYDNFANNLMHGNRELYEQILHGEGYIRTFFKGIKEGTEKGVFTKVFVTGVTPIMLDDVTSGANNFTNVGSDLNLNEVLGFTEEEVEEIIKYYRLDEILDGDELRKTLRTYTNGYLFNEEAKTTLYNTDMLLYIVKNIIAAKKYPKDLVDRNVMTDYSKISNIARNFITKEDMVKIIENRDIGPVIINERFNLDSMSLGVDAERNVKSLLYYLGLVTIKETCQNAVILTIPNYTIEKVYWSYIAEVYKVTVNIGYEKLKEAMDFMRLEGKMEPVMNLYEKALRNLSDKDLRHHTEETSKGMFITLMSTDGLYLIESEKKASDGYTDLYLKEDVIYKEYIKYRYVIEFKHVKLSELKRDKTENETVESLINLNNEKIEQLEKGAVTQLKNYIKEKNIINDSNLTLKKLVIITLGRKYAICREVY